MRHIRLDEPISAVLDSGALMLVRWRNNEYWYFEVSPAGVQFLGKYYYDPENFPPTWWGEAVTNINLYQHLSQCPVE